MSSCKTRKTLPSNRAVLNPVNILALTLQVYDMSKFMNLHPGGKAVLLDAEVGAYLALSRRDHEAVPAEGSPVILYHCAFVSDPPFQPARMLPKLFLVFTDTRFFSSLPISVSSLVWPLSFSLTTYVSV